MSKYYYLTCPSEKVGVRLGQGHDGIHAIYTAQVGALTNFLNRHQGHCLKFLNETDSDFILEEGWILEEVAEGTEGTATGSHLATATMEADALGRMTMSYTVNGLPEFEIQGWNRTFSMCVRCGATWSPGDDEATGARSCPECFHSPLIATPGSEINDA